MAKTLRASIFALIIVIVALLGTTVGAVEGAGVLVEYTQPTGDKFKAAVYGDERINWVTAETGEIIVQDKDKYWKYAEKIKGKIQPSSYTYSKKGQRPVEVIKNKDILIMMKKDPTMIKSPLATSSTTQTAQQSGGVQSGSNQAPATSQKILVLLVQFTNQTIRYTDSAWSNSFFGNTGSSVNSYYNEVSGGTFGFTAPSETYGTPDDGVIKVTLNYAHPNTGGNTGYANQKIVTDALIAADPYINYAAYDTNRNGTMEPNELHIVTVVAGYEAAYGGPSPSIWAHKWSTSATVEGIRFSEYTQEGEVHYDHMATIGVLAHELGHDLGVPDLYDYDRTSSGVGIHSIMAGGSWASQVYPGDSPTHFDAWSKIKLGFATPTLTGTGDYTVSSFDTGQYNILKVPTTNPDQYFLVENRQNKGFDKGLANRVGAFGTAIWHIDEGVLRTNYWRPNDNEARKGVDLEEANEGALGYSQLDKNSSGTYKHYYSTGNVTTFGPSTVPNSKLYEGTNTNITITTNVPSSSAMVVNILNAGAEVPPQITNAKVDVNPFAPVGNNNAVVSYTLSKDANVTIQILDANNAVVRTLESSAAKLKGDLTSVWDGKNASGNIVGDGAYTIKITAVDKVGLSASATVPVTVEASNPVISNVGDTPDPYTGAGTTVSTISYTVSENANVNIKIYDNNNNLVKSLFTGQVAAGARTVTWNGKNDLAKPAQNGVYTYKINAVDGANKAAQEAVGTITIDRGAPITLILYGQKPDPFRASTKITYGITQNGAISLDIFDSNNNIVRNLLVNSQKVAGTHYVVWTGRNNAGAQVPSGVYKYTVSAEDQNGNIGGPFSGTVTIDRTGPEISNLNVSVNPFAPNGGNDTTASYTLLEDVKVTANIFDSKNALVRTMVNKATQVAGVNSFIWDGKDKYDELVGDGTYTVKVSAVDSLGNRSATKTQTIIVDRAAPSIDAVSDSPDPLRVGDGLVNTIKYTASENVHVTIKIYDIVGTLVKTLVDADVLAGSRQVVWDGKNDGGAFVQDGTYTYKINAVDPSGKAALEKIGTIKTDKTAVVIYNVGTNPTKFAPSGAILYSLSKDAKVTIKIYNSINQEVKTIENAVQKTAGSQTSIWDGLDSLGKDAASGTFKFKITAVDEVGFNAVPQEGTFELQALDKDAPRITNVSDAPDPLKLGAAGAGTTIRYTLSENAQVSIKIYTVDGTLVRTLVNTSVIAGDKFNEWNGKNDSGSLVADGNYIYKINAMDDSGNRAGEVIGTITTDKTAVTITNVTLNPAKFAISGSIGYTLSENAKVTITIYDSLNNEVKTIENAVQKNAGAQTAVWDGKDKNGFDVQSGNYTYIITAIDQVGFMAIAQGTVIVEGPAPVISNLSSDPEPFISSGSNIVTMSYTITTNANVTLKIYDDNNRLIKTVLNGAAVLRGQNTATWNGKNENGNLVADGVYSYKITAVDAVGKASNEAVGTITIDKTAPTILNVSANPNSFGTGSNTTISYVLSEKVNVTVKVLDGSGNTVRTLEDNVLKGQGMNSVIWDGKNSSGVYALGTFTFKITATDAAKFSTNAVGSVTVIDSSTPVITEVSDTPDLLSLNGTSTVNILSTLSKDMSVTIKIYNSTGSLVKTLVNNVQQLKGKNSVWWDGKNDAGVLVQEGVYTYKINGVDALGKAPTEAVGTISAGTLLTITNDSVSKDPYLADGTATVNISYTLSKAAAVTVKILDSSNNAVRTISNASGNAGSNTIAWDGKNSSGSIVADGIYTYKIDVVDSINQTVSASKSFVVVGSLPGISNIGDAPDPFKPDGSLSTITYTLSKNSLVTLEIFDKNNALVKTLVKGTAQAKGVNKAFWNGTDNVGSIVKDGNYTYKITVVDSFSKQSVEGIGAITVQMYPPAGDVKDLSVTPNPYAPNAGNAAISYTLTGDAYVTVEIADSNNVVVKTFDNRVSKTSGTYNLSWDGKGSNGSIVSDGIYTLKVTAVNGADAGSTVTSGFIVERTAPVISEVNDTPDPFKNNGVDLWSLNFSLSEDANVYLELRDANGGIAWTAVPVIFTKGARAIELYGTNDSGQLLNDGTYTYKLWAVDLLNKKSNEVTGTLLIDKTAPVITKVGATPSAFTTSTTVSYTLSENAKVTVTISNGNTVVRTLESEVSKSVGADTVVWDGKDSSGISVENGTYTYTITAVDGVGLTAKATGSVVKDAGVPVINGVSDTNDPFNASGSNITTINYTISKNAFVSIKIYDGSGTLVKTLLNNYPASKGANTANWDGKNDSGALLNDGVYTYRINAVDTLGVSAVQVGGTITIDRIAPAITNFTANPYPFAPNGSDNMTIGYNVSEAAKITLEVLDDENNVIRALESAAAKGAGANTTLWDGTVGGSILEDGIYRIKITAADGAGNSSEYYDFVGIDRLVPEIIQVDDEPDPFNPKIVDFSTIHGLFSEWLGTSSAALYDSSNNQVKKVDMEDTIEFWWGWSGTDALDKVVKDGVYTYKINGEDLFGKAAKEATGAVTVDSILPEIIDVSFTPELENPSGTINYTLSKASKVSIAIYDSSNNILNQLELNADKNQGPNTVYWDGTSKGKLVGYGVYTFKITAEATNGSSALPAVGVITFETIDPDFVDNTIDDNVGEEQTGGPNASEGRTAPVISNTQYSLNYGAPGGLVSYTISEKSYVTVSIYNSANTLLRSLESAALKNQGSYTAVWDGRDSGGTLVSAGTYTYKISAVDTTGNQAAPVIAAMNVEQTKTANSSSNSSNNTNKAPSQAINIKLNPSIFTPSGSITYTLAENARVITVILNSSNEVVRFLETDIAKGAGKYTITWDGRNSAGDIVPNGNYTYRITTVSLKGVQSAPVTGIIPVNYKPFAITNIDVSPKNYNPKGSAGGLNPATIMYTLSENATVSVSIYAANNTLVKVISTGVQQPSGANYMTWYGTDNMNARVSSGTYTFKVKAVSSAGVEGQASGTINVQ